MGNFSGFWDKLAERIKRSERPSPSTVTIPRNHIDKNQNSELDYKFTKDQHYFQVMINEMYLTEQRRGLVNVDPLVYTVCEFSYKKKTQIVPFLVGPSMLKEKGVPDQYSQGIIIRNTSVSGLHPYRGEGLTLAIVLLEARQNALRPLLSVIERISGALNFSPALAPYMSVAGVLMEGFEAFFNAGGVEPLVGLRDSYGPNYNIPFQPGYYALIDAPGIDEGKLWVKKNQLMIGDSLKSAGPFRQADFVLYSFIGPEENKRDDLDKLPFSETWDKVRDEAASPVDDPDYKNALVQMGALYRYLVSSPDLTEDHADELAENWFARMDAIHKKAKMFGLQAGEEEMSDEERAAKARQDKTRRRVLEIVKGL